MEEIIRFVTLAQTDRFTITDLCEQFGISRKTAYKHLERYAAGGLKALQPRSHRPHHCPQRTDEAIEAMVLAERRLHHCSKSILSISAASAPGLIIELSR